MLIRPTMLKYNLQFFAADDKGHGEGGSDDPDQTGEDKNTTGAGSGTQGGNGSDDSGTKTETPEKTFTQKQVTSMMTKEKKQGRNAAYAELGIDPNNAQQVAMVKALIDSQKTDEQKQQEQNAENAAKIAEAEHRAQVAEAKAEAMKLGAKPEFVDDIVTLAMSKMGDNTDIESVIGDLKTKYGVWFEAGEQDDKNATGQKGTGSSVNGKGTGSGSGNSGEQSLGARLAAKRQNVGGKDRKSYWD